VKSVRTGNEVRGAVFLPVPRRATAQITGVLRGFAARRAEWLCLSGTALNKLREAPARGIASRVNRALGKGKPHRTVGGKPQNRLYARGRFADLIAIGDFDPGVSLRSTPGFMPSPRFAGSMSLDQRARSPDRLRQLCFASLVPRECAM